MIQANFAAKKKTRNALLFELQLLEKNILIRIIDRFLSIKKKKKEKLFTNDYWRKRSDILKKYDRCRWSCLVFENRREMSQLEERRCNYASRHSRGRRTARTRVERPGHVSLRVLGHGRQSLDFVLLPFPPSICFLDMPTSHFSPRSLFLLSRSSMQLRKIQEIHRIGDDTSNFYKISPRKFSFFDQFLWFFFFIYI